MRMYTLHFGQGLEHTQHLLDQAKGNIPYNFEGSYLHGGVNGWANGAGPVPNAECGNGRIVSHKEIFSRYGVKGGHGEYCLETWRHNVLSPENSCQLHTGGYGDMPFGGYPKDTEPFYLKFDFMYTNTGAGTVIILQRTKVNDVSRDLTLSIESGILSVMGSMHLTPPDTDPPSYLETEWLPRTRDNKGTAYLRPDKWHEIQIFVQPYAGWDVSRVGPDLGPRGYYDVADPGVHGVDSFWPAFQAYEFGGNSFGFSLKGAENKREPQSNNYPFPLQIDAWPSGGHPQHPNAMLPGQDQTSWPPENYASGQYFHGANLGLIYVWVNGKIDIQHTTSMSNETNPTEGTDWRIATSQQSIFLGYDISDSTSSDQQSGRFFYDNIIWNDIRDPSGSLPSKIFIPSFSSHASLEWNPGYDLKFVAMEMDDDFWSVDALYIPGSRRHDTWLPESPLGALVPSGNPYYVVAPNRYGSPTDSMIPHGTKLTVIHTDWDGTLQEYIVDGGNRNLYADYNVDYAYQCLQPNESNPFAANQDDPRISSSTSGDKSLFYLKRPPATSGKQPLAGGFGLGGTKDYVPNIATDLGESGLPSIYRIWTCLQDHIIGSNPPTDKQYHLIRVPSGVSGFVDYVSDNPCPGDRTYRSYHDGSSASANGYSMSDWPYNPVTGDPWTWDDLDTIQVGVYHGTNAGINTAVIYTSYIVVEHATAIDPEIGILGNNLFEWDTADDIPFVMQKKYMYVPGWKFFDNSQNRQYYNRWDVDPIFSIGRTNRQTADGQATISQPQYSGTIEWDYYIRYINGEIVPGPQYRAFDEHFPEVWVYTTSGFIPPQPIRQPMRGEVITDANGNNFTFLTYPVLQWNNARYPNSHNLSPSPLDRYPYVLYDYNTMYVVPLTTHNVADGIDPSEVLRTWTDSDTKPSTSGSLGIFWAINLQQNAFNFMIDQDSYFHPFSPSSVANHILTHPNESLDTTFPVSRDNHDYYFQAPNAGSGSVTQTIHLADKFGVPETAIDNGLYEVNLGLYQTTVNQASNDTGEGRFDFYGGKIGNEVLISGHTFGLDGTAGWHLNEATVVIPSGTRRVKFTFSAIRNTDGSKSPGGTLGGTSNFAAFDEPFFIMAMSSGYATNTYHPADINQDNRIGYDELATYISLWQSGLLPTGQAKDYMTAAENIWQSGVSTFFNDPSGGLYYNANDGPKPENWIGSGLV